MSSTEPGQNRVKTRRLARGWSQAELAERAGISRAAVSAIEVNRLVPSVAAALALAAVLECSVEELFSSAVADRRQVSPAWAWPSLHEAGRYWCGHIHGRLMFYPAEATPLGSIPHDGIGEPEFTTARVRLAESTLVMAGCDPAVGLLARVYERVTGYRMLVFPRSSRQALELLQQGLVHVAGVHLAADGGHDGNAASVKQIVNQPARLLRVASWEDGVAIGSGISARSVRGLLSDRVTWVGREPGSGARQCLDELLSNRPAPRRLARDHRGVAEAVRCGWADAGVCLQLVAEEAGLRFLPVRTEDYELCFTLAMEADPRVQSLVRVIKSPEYRQLLGELPGYATRASGEMSTVS